MHWSENIGKFWSSIIFFYFSMNLYYIDTRFFMLQNFKFVLSVVLSVQNLFKEWHGEFLTFLTNIVPILSQSNSFNLFPFEFEDPF